MGGTQQLEALFFEFEGALGELEEVRYADQVTPEEISEARNRVAFARTALVAAARTAAAPATLVGSIGPAIALVLGERGTPETRLRSLAKID